MKKIKVYTLNGVVLSGEVTNEAAQDIADWLGKRFGKKTYLLSDNDVQRILYKDNVSMIEFSDIEV